MPAFALCRIVVLPLLMLCLSSAAMADSGVTSVAPAQAFILKDTEVRTIRAKTLERDYEIYVSLPDSYRSQPRRRFPVLYVTDADYAFPLVRSIAQRVGNRAQGLEEFILVGLSHAIGDSREFSRRRDYTPTPHGEKTRDPEGRRPLFGEAEPYRRFLAEEVMPFVAATYRTDTTRSLYAGHSYGGLFGLHVLLTQASMFSHYIIGSPSLWFDRRVMFARERAFAEANRDLGANVLMAIGSFETVNPASDDRRYSRKLDMVADFRAFEQALRGRNYPGLRLTTEVIGEEDHLTAFPAIVTRGLLWALPASRR
ncbi:MAG: alpha/beta hydrolase [Beijerinckiaceae bacterium]|nr:alpha/beta hydrolase [Beijerinckiaceae bacterium]